jgi:hypothetical protein
MREPGIQPASQVSGFRVCAEEAHPGMTALSIDENRARPYSRAHD